MRISAVAGGAVLLAAAFAPGGAAAPSPAAKPFSAHASCGLNGKHRDRFCFEKDHPVAVYRAFGRADVEYRVCARKRGARKRCADRRTNNPGQRSRTRIALHGSGRYQLTWFERGAAVDRDKLAIRKRAVFLVGDSLSQGTKPYLPHALPGWRVEQSVSISRHAPEGVAILRRRGGLPGVVVFALGTNDDPRGAGEFRDALQATLAVVGPTRCVVVPNIVRPAVGGASYAAYNRAMSDLARDDENFRLVDWAGSVSRNRDWLAEDGAHVSAEGYRARALLIARQVERC